MADISGGLEFEENVNFTIWWEEDSVFVGDPVVLLALLLAMLFPVLELVHLIDHLYFFEFGEVFIWILNCDLICLSLFCSVFNWNGHEVNISWNDWHLN